MEVLALADFVREEPFRPGFGGRYLQIVRVFQTAPLTKVLRGHNLPQGVGNKSQPGEVGLLANGHVQRKQHFSVVCVCPAGENFPKVAAGCSRAAPRAAGLAALGGGIERSLPVNVGRLRRAACRR